MKTPDQAYEFLKSRFAQIKNLTNAASILGKDMETVMAPGSTHDRIRQIVAIGGAAHGLIADPKVGDALDLAESGTKELGAADARNLSLMRHQWIHEASLPDTLAAERARLESEGRHLHVLHYRAGNWAVMRDWYAHSFKIMREVGAAKKDLLKVGSVYDALLDEFSPGLRNDRVVREFSALDTALRRMIPQALEKQAREPEPIDIMGPFPRDSQIALNRAIVSATGFDTNRGILFPIDGHPSSSGSSDDNRITTRISEDDFTTSLYATIHESGHGVYDQNLPVEWRYQPAGDHLGMSVHESQSMIFEYQAAMSAPYLEWLSGALQRTFSRMGDESFGADNLRRSLWRAVPSYIRVEADELTYPMHVLLRHSIESRMADGTMHVDDIPDAWNDGMKDRLGITPQNPAQGHMQDVHWPTGSVGYFPAYTMGAMGAAQLFAAATAQDDSILPALARGDFTPMKAWLVRHVHSRGASVDSDTIFKDATGRTLDAGAYLKHLHTRYLDA